MEYYYFRTFWKHVVVKAFAHYVVTKNTIIKNFGKHFEFVGDLSFIIYGDNITKQGCSYHGPDKQVRGHHDECVIRHK